MVRIQPMRRTDRHGHPVENDGMFRADLFQQAQRLAAFDHVIFRDHLDKIDGHIAVQKVGVVGTAKAEPETGKWCDIVHLLMSVKWREMATR